jgi:hypothetical protein
MPSESTPEPKFLTSTRPFPFNVGEILKKGTEIEHVGGTLVLDCDMKVSSLPICSSVPMLYQANLHPIDD